MTALFTTHMLSSLCVFVCVELCSYTGKYLEKLCSEIIFLFGAIIPKPGMDKLQPRGPYAAH